MKTLLIFAAAFLMAILVGECAHAAPLRGDPSSCNDLGRIVVQAAEARDQGVPWDAVNQRLQEMIKDAKTNDDSYVHTDEEGQFVTDAIHRLWIDANDPGFVVATKVFNVCMGNKGTV